MEQFISRPGSSFPCLQLQVVVAHLHERLAAVNQKVHGDSGWWVSPKLSDSWEFQEWSHVHIFGAKREKEVSVVIWNLGSHNSRSLVRITPSSGDRHLSVIAGTHTDSARRAQSIRQSFLTNNPLRPPDGSSISLLLSGGLNTVLSWFRSKVFYSYFSPSLGARVLFYRPWSRSVVIKILPSSCF